MKKTVLFPNVGRRVELVERFKNISKKNAIELSVIGTDITNDAPALAFCDKVYILPSVRDQVLVDKFHSILQENDVDIVVCTIDPDLEFFSKHRKNFSYINGKFVDLLLSKSNIINIASNKKKTEDFFRSVGVLTPQTISNPSAFPIFAKPIKGSGSFGAMVLNSAEELHEYLLKYGEYSPIFQEFIKGKEYTIDCFISQKGQISLSSRERVKVRSGEVVVSQIVKLPNLEKEVRKVLLNQGFYGPVTLQVIIKSDTNDIYFIEINDRFGGGVILSIESGMETPLYILLGKGKANYIKPKMKMLRYDMSVFVDENVQ